MVLICQSLAPVEQSALITQLNEASSGLRFLVLRVATLSPLLLLAECERLFALEQESERTRVTDASDRDSLASLHIANLRYMSRA